MLESARSSTTDPAPEKPNCKKCFGKGGWHVRVRLPDGKKKWPRRWQVCDWCDGTGKQK
jgi:DnaJ-class molecular chaperone